MEAVDVEEVAAVEEEVVVIQISPTTPGMVLISKRFRVILALPIGMHFREMVENILSVNEAVQNLVADTVMAVHVGDVVVAEDNIYYKLILIGLNFSMEDVAAEKWCTEWRSLCRRIILTPKLCHIIHMMDI